MTSNMSLADALGAHNTFDITPDVANGAADDAEMEDLFGDDEDVGVEPPTQARYVARLSAVCTFGY